MLSKASKLANKSSSKHLWLLISLCAILLVKLVSSVVKVSNNNYNAAFSHNVAVTFGVCGFLGIVAFVVFYYFCNYKNFTIENLYIPVVFLFGLVYMVLFTPFTVPDELVHFMSAYKVSNYFILNFKQFTTEEIFVRNIDLKFFEDANVYISAQEYFKATNGFSVFADQFSLTTLEQTVGKSVPMGYLVSGLGIAIARILKFSPIMVFYMGRIFNILQYIVLSRIALKITPIGKRLIFVLSLLPMTLHLLASYSYDCYIVAISLIFVALFLKIYYSEQGADLKTFLLMVGVAVLLAPSKMVYLPIIFLVFLLKKENLAFCSEKTASILKVSTVLVGIVSLLLFQLDFLSSDVAVSGEKMITWVEAPGFTIGDILGDPMGSIRFFLRTLQEKGDSYVIEMIGGCLGWLQINIALIYYVPFLIIIVLSMFGVEGEPLSFNFYERFYSLVLVCGSVTLVILSMWLAWTPILYNVVMGVQGRYFLPLVPVLYLIVRGNHICLQKDTEHSIMTATVFFGIIYTFEILTKTFI